MKKPQLTTLSLIGLFFLITTAFSYNPNNGDPAVPVRKDGVKKVVYTPHKKKVSYDMVVKGQSRRVTYLIQGSRDKPLIIIIVNRSGKSTLRLRTDKGRSPILDGSWDDISRYALGKNVMTHPYYGFKALQQSQPKAMSIPVGPIIDILGKIKIFECKTKASCTCSNGSTINITCKCRQSARCIETEVIRETQTPDGGTSREKQIICDAMCI